MGRLLADLFYAGDFRFILLCNMPYFNRRAVHVRSPLECRYRNRYIFNEYLNMSVQAGGLY
jgi:hypothetical protein